MTILPNSTSPLEDVIKSSIQQIINGKPEDGIIDGPINFNIAYMVNKEAGGGIGINVVNAGAKVSENQIQRLSFAYRIPSDMEMSEMAAKKAKAEAEKSQAEYDKMTADDKKRMREGPSLLEIQGRIAQQKRNESLKKK